VFLTYREMDSLANSLASELMAIGVRRGKLAGICMDKSIEMFISILAILKAGAGYVPLDPEYPAERIQTIMGIAETTIVLTSTEIFNQLEGVVLGSHNWLVVDVRNLSLASKPDAGPIMRGDVCHVLFTSGSTGTPKGTRNISWLGVMFTSDVSGVVLTHGSVIESITASREIIGVQAGRVLQFANYAFDITVWVSMERPSLAKIRPYVSC
jgi:non-ribosomal peptide synthetase component F